jgi:hypothetical protein
MVRVFGVFRGYQIRPLTSDLWRAFRISVFSLSDFDLQFQHVSISAFPLLIDFSISVFQNVSF